MSDDPEEDTRETTGAVGPGGEEAFATWLAEVWDEEIEPSYARRFWEMALASLQIPEKGQVLVAGCSTGAVIPALFEQIEVVGQGRVVALEARGPLLAKARARVAELDRRRVFLKGESIRKLRFADGVFSAIISSLTWMDLPEPGMALREFFRVLAPGGQVALGVPLEGTLQEIYDLFAEVALKYELPEVHKSLEQQRMRRNPSVTDAKGLLEGVGFVDVDVRHEEQTLAFSSGRRFFDSVLVKALFEPHWREVAGDAADHLFRSTREAIDTYFVGDPLSVAVVVGCIRGRRPA
jgi:SAM-dependent methyltransferase